VWDGKGNPTHLDYDAHNQLVRIVSREPFRHEMLFHYDANGNPIKANVSFERHAFDPTKGEVALLTTTISQQIAYDLLNYPVQRITSAEGQQLRETFVRDASERVVQSVQPMGNTTTYHFDERNLLIEKRLGSATKDEVVCRYTYTLNGKRSTRTDGQGNTLHYHYDGFQRSIGMTNAEGIVIHRVLDPAGNTTLFEVMPDPAALQEAGSAPAVPLLQMYYQYDELNRLTQINRAWYDLSSGMPSGKSQLNGQTGFVSTILEYQENPYPSMILGEAGSQVRLEYDGIDRLLRVEGLLGNVIQFDYDENSNITSMARLQQLEETGALHPLTILTQQFDALDRVVARSVNQGQPEQFVYNALGLLMLSVNQAQVKRQLVHDVFGRRLGWVTTATNDYALPGMSKEQLIIL